MSMPRRKRPERAASEFRLGRGAVVALRLVPASSLIVVLLAAGPVAANSPVAIDAPVLIETRCGPARASDLAIDIHDRVATVVTRCVADRAGRAVVRTVRRPVPWQRQSVRFESVLAPAMFDRITVERRRAGTGQRITARRPDGARCFEIIVTPIRAIPLLQRFLGSDGDWRGTIDYLVTPDCEAVALRAGNRVAIASTGRAQDFVLDGLRVSVRR